MSKLNRFHNKLLKLENNNYTPLTDPTNVVIPNILSYQDVKHGMKLNKQFLF